MFLLSNFSLFMLQNVWKLRLWGIVIASLLLFLESWISIFLLIQNVEYWCLAYSWAFPVQGRFLAETSRICRNPEGTWDVISKGK